MTVPSSSYYTEQSRWLMEKVLSLHSTIRNGGIYANKSGYHNTRAGNDRSWPGNYSVTAPVDRGGPADKAAAYDFTFVDAQAGNYSTINLFSQRLMKSSLDMDDGRLNGYREWYGNTDPDSQVEGYDTRNLYPASSDSSHLWHIHVSEQRDLVGSYINKKCLLSVLAGETLAEYHANPTNFTDDSNWVYRGTGAVPPVVAPPVATSFPLPSGHVFGDINGPEWMHGGFYGSEPDHSNIVKIQRRLIALGFAPNEAGWADGKYEQPTIDSVKKFQQSKGDSTPDGMVGPWTWGKLFG